MAVTCLTRIDLEDRLDTSRLMRNALSIEGFGEKVADNSSEGLTLYVLVTRVQWKARPSV